MENNEVNSDLLKSNWHLIKSTYNKLKKESEREDQEASNYYSISQLMVDEWKDQYSSFVLNPIEKEVLSLFQKVQTKEFEKIKSISTDVELFGVYYYTIQYFYIFIEPFDLDEPYEDQPRFEIKTENQNIKLRQLFREMWFEIYPKFDSNEYYDIIDSNLKEYDSLYRFLSECWLKMKNRTNSKVRALMTEATGVDNPVYLDGLMSAY